MSSEPHLAVNLRHRIGQLTLETDFATCAPWTILFGPSGSGKSTLLRAIAGLLRPDHGTIVIHGQPVCDREHHLWLSPRLRPARWSSQTATLFPHMSVTQNLDFGLKHGGPSPRDTHATVAEALSHFHLQHLATRRPAQLSGGEQRRTAVARAAIGARGKLLLLDEPFTGLDNHIRDQLIYDLRTWLNGTPVLSVTHDATEALLLRAHVVRLAEGKVIAQGPASTVLESECSRLRDLLG